MRIWIDADAAPTAVKTIVFRAANRLQIETILVANQSIPFPAGCTTVRNVVVREGPDQADRYIVAQCTPGDIAITADLPLAALLVDKDVHVIDPRGDELNANTIRSRVSMRDFMDEMRGAGMQTGGNAPYNDKDKRSFAATFDRLVTKATRRAGLPPSTNSRT